ncbi:MAG: Ig-like domain-containing protein, partial [Pseudomonadota bacterium]|nr:Ig-like domain-containing protein [Pseudomonadota bacterium]
MIRFTLAAILLAWSSLVGAVTASITAPAADATYTAPASFTVSSTADAWADGERLTSHVLYRNGAQIASGTTRIVSASASGLAVGSYRFHSVAKNNLGQTVQSPVRTITVAAPGSNRPSVTLGAPTGAPFIAPATVGLSATASDSDGSVAKVEFFAGATLLGTDTAAPYQVTWGNVAAGTYSVTAKATDNNGNSAVSAAQSVVVGTSTIKGNIEGLTADAALAYRLQGWACSTGRDASVVVHVYVGGPAGSGDFLIAHGADQPSEPAVAAACQANGTAYRFSIPISDAMRQQHANKKIHVHGISPVGASNLTIDGSGVLSIPAPLAVTRRYYYDSQQRVCRTMEPETGSTVLEYDPAGNIVSATTGLALPATAGCYRPEATASGRSVLRQYDNRNRVRTLSFPDRNGDQDWQYTVTGQPAQITTYNDGGANHVVNAYTYNKRGMPTGESSTQPGWYSWGIGYSHDRNGNLAGQRYPSGFYVDYAPNALGQATRAGSMATGVSYHPNGALRQFTYGNGLVHSMGQNARQLPSEVINSGVFHFTFRYDANGNTTNIDDVYQQAGQYTGSRDMRYDALDRLSYAHLHWRQVDNFAYDGIDNIVSKSHFNGTTTVNHAYVYDPANRLTNVRNADTGASVVGLGYDFNGNLQNKNGLAHHFDLGNRLRGVDGKESYRYDGHGRRVLAWSPSQGSILSQYSQGGQVMFQEDHRKPGVEAQEHVYLSGSLVATRVRNYGGGTTQVKYQHTDALGSPVAVSNEAGTVIDRTHYEPYGAAINKLVQGIGYTGHLMDATTGLTYMQQRYYDPGVGRFLSVDPVTADGNTGGNFNRYWYANNNPYRFTDPDGRVSDEVERQPKPDRRSMASRPGLGTSNISGLGSSRGGGRRDRKSRSDVKEPPTAED